MERGGRCRGCRIARCSQDGVVSAGEVLLPRNSAALVEKNRARQAPVGLAGQVFYFGSCMLSTVRILLFPLSKGFFSPFKYFTNMLTYSLLK